MRPGFYERWSHDLEGIGHLLWYLSAGIWIGEYLNSVPEPRATNSYDFVRFCAAAAVLYSHNFALAGIPEPRVPGYGEDFGKVGVEVFFCLSGFLICRSLQKSSDWAQFTSARFLRIFPNLTFALVATSSGTLVWYHNYANIWPHIKYVVGNLLMFFKGVTYVVPGVFTDAKFPALNGPLWSLPCELWLYVLLFLLFQIGRRRTGTFVVLTALLLSIAWTAAPLTGNLILPPFDSFQFSRLGSYFLCGSILAFGWNHLQNHAIRLGAAGLIAVFLLRCLIPTDTIFQSLALAGAVIGLGSSKVMAWFSRGGDASYGMYIFAWPVQQFSLLLINSFWASLLVAFLITTALGYATWHIFERRIMLSRGQFAERLRKVALWGVPG